MKVISLSGSFYKTTSDSDNYYVITTSGIVVVDKNNEQIKTSGNTSYYFTDIWTDENSSLIYISSSGNGVLAVDKGHLNLSDISNKFGSKYSEPEISSNDVLCINGNSSTNLLIGTASGTDLIIDGNVYTSTSFYPVTDVFILDSNKIFYSGDFGLAGAVEENLSYDWEEADLSFVIDETTIPTIDALPIRDIDVTENDYYITIGLATYSGIQIINYIKGSTINTSSVLKLLVGS